MNNKLFMKDPSIFIQHIFDSLIEIENYTSNFSEEDFSNTTQTQDAVIRRLEIIGEAVKNLAITFRNEYPDIPWSKMAGMRDVLIHDYFGVDLSLVWKIVEKEVPKLKKQMRDILDEIT